LRFKRHLFISYTHKDNKPLFSDAEGWVTRFHKTLGTVLEQRLGRAPEIWRDERLQGNDVFTPEIMAKLPESAVLLAVVSEGYISSKWCLDEAHAFCAAAEKTGGLTRDNKSRVFKVFKAPPATLAPLPAVMREMTGYDFFERNADNAPKELDPDFDKDSRAKYIDQVMTLAFHLASLIKRLDAEAANDASAGPVKPAVYLAECDYDRSSDRRELAINLAVRGYRVLPDRELPRGEEAYRKAVQEALSRCALAVHLVGNDSGWIPEGPGKCPAVELQNAETAARARAGGLRRVVSLPAGVQGSNERQQQFIRALHTDHEVQGGQGGELITADLEVVKKAVLDALAEIEAPPPPAPAVPPGMKVVYLICDPRDSDAADPIGEWLASRGCKVRLPAFAADATAARKAHEERLAQCDAVLVYYGAGTKDWYASVLTDIAKAPSLRPGARPIDTVYTWLAPGESFDKTKRIDRAEPRIIDGLNGFDAALGEPFLASLQAAQ
jgi:hypothetical protein